MMPGDGEFFLAAAGCGVYVNINVDRYTTPSRRTSDMGVETGRCTQGMFGITDENCGTSATIVCMELENR